jgi:hypothetical protein
MEEKPAKSRFKQLSLQEPPLSLTSVLLPYLMAKQMSLRWARRQRLK